MRNSKAKALFNLPPAGGGRFTGGVGWRVAFTSVSTSEGSRRPSITEAIPWPSSMSLIPVDAFTRGCSVGWMIEAAGEEGLGLIGKSPLGAGVSLWAGMFLWGLLPRTRISSFWGLPGYALSRNRLFSFKGFVGISSLCGLLGKASSLLCGFVEKSVSSLCCALLGKLESSFEGLFKSSLVGLEGMVLIGGKGFSGL